MATRVPARMTRQKRAILDELTTMKTHPSADEVYARVRRKLPRVSLGTVYRNLERLSADGVIRTITLAGASRRFDGCLEEHDHVRCLGCGRIDDIPPSPTGGAARRIRKSLDYDITGRRLEFTGFCPKCRRSKARRGNGGG